MKSRTRFTSASVTLPVGCLLFLNSQQSFGGNSAIATLANGFKSAAFGPNGPGVAGVAAFSKQNIPMNAGVTPTVVLNGTAQMVALKPPTVANTFGVGPNAVNIAMTGLAVGIQTKPGANIAATYALQENALKQAGDGYNIISKTLDFTGTANAFLDPKGVGTLEASASQAAGSTNKGNAAGRAADPFTVSSGTYAYAPTITGSIEVDLPGQTSNVNCLVIDSSVVDAATVDNFDDGGNPTGVNLWSVSLLASTPTTTVAGVNVDFELNPAALNEITYSTSFLSTIGAFTNQTTEAVAIDAATDAYITSQLTATGSEVDFNSLNVFPPGTTYTPLGTSVEYLDSDAVTVTSVPEPATASLLLALAAPAVAARRLARPAR